MHHWQHDGITSGWCHHVLPWGICGWGFPLLTSWPVARRSPQNWGKPHPDLGASNPTSSGKWLGKDLSLRQVLWSESGPCIHLGITELPGHLFETTWAHTQEKCIMYSPQVSFIKHHFVAWLTCMWLLHLITVSWMWLKFVELLVLNWNGTFLPNEPSSTFGDFLHHFTKLCDSWENNKCNPVAKAPRLMFHCPVLATSRWLIQARQGYTFGGIS